MMDTLNGALGRRIRVALIGGGGSGFIGKVHAIAATLDCRADIVAGAMSSKPEVAKESALRLGIDPARAYVSLDELLEGEGRRGEEERVDVIAIATPNHTHAPFACAAMDAGFHVVCDKPLANSLEEARRIEQAVTTNDRIFGLTHNYSGYPLVRQARAMVQSGELGQIIAVRAQYLQGWKQIPVDGPLLRGAWKNDPKFAGPTGTMADVGTHAFHLGTYITGFSPDLLSCQMRSYCDPTLDDYGVVNLTQDDGALMSICVSQVSHGRQNDLRIDIDGTKGALSWRQEEPNTLTVLVQGEPVRTFERHPGADYLADEQRAACRIPPGHPEAFYEAFANIYRGVYDDVAAKILGQPLTYNYPTIRDGVDGVAFIEACVQSAQSTGQWVELQTD